MISQLALFDAAPAPEFVDSGATFSADRKYRTRLHRTWDASKPLMVVVLLNPSIADESRLDPTLTRVKGFAMALGYGGFVVLNLFAIVGTDPVILTELGAEACIGDGNDHAIMSAVCDPRCGIVIAGWGAESIAQARGATVVRNIALVRDVWCLGVTKCGAPRHPLYLAASTKPALYKARIVPMVSSGCTCGNGCGAICAAEIAAKASACGLDWDELEAEANG